jgi:hypothetical protein
MPKLKPGTVVPTPEEDAAITAAAMQDPDAIPYTDKEWTDQVAGDNKRFIPLLAGDVVQLSPEVRNPMFAGCMMIVTEPSKSWGAQGYVQALGKDGAPGGRAYYRATWAEMEFVGRAVWLAE